MESKLTTSNTNSTSTLNAAHSVNTPSTRTKFVPVGVILLLLALFPMLHLAMGGAFNFYLHLILLVFVHITLASSWKIMGGYAGYVSLGHNMFFAIGGYFSAVLLRDLDVSVFISAPLAGLLALLFGLLVGFITLRVRGPSFIIATIALVLVLRIVLDNWRFVGGANGMSLKLLPLPVEWSKIPFYYALLLTAMFTVYLSYRVRHSKLGLGLRAISQDEVKAESAGIPTNLYKILAFAISGYFIGVAGALYGQYITYVRPDIFLLILVGAQMVLMCLIGGKGTVAGPVIGAAAVIIGNEIILQWFGSSALNIFVTGLAMILILVFFPDGIVGSLRKMGKLPAFLDWD